MRGRLRSILTDTAIVFGLVAAVTMTACVAAIFGAICSMIFGGSFAGWTFVMVCVDASLVVWLLRRLVNDYWEDYERKTNL